MCLALPMQVESIDESGMAALTADGLRQRASLRLLPEAEVGDYVLVHAGFAIAHVSADEAAETLALMAELAEADEEVKRELDELRDQS